MTSPTSQIGISGELLACLDMRTQGYIAFPSSADCPYDVVLDTGSRLYRVQVKSTISSRLCNPNQQTPTWIFSLRRQGSQGRKFYSAGDYDILALAALDIRKVAYLPQTSLRSAITLRSADLEYSKRTKGGTYLEDLPLEKALAGVPL